MFLEEFLEILVPPVAVVVGLVRRGVLGRVWALLRVEGVPLVGGRDVVGGLVQRQVVVALIGGDCGQPVLLARLLALFFEVELLLELEYLVGLLALVVKRVVPGTVVRGLGPLYWLIRSLRGPGSGSPVPFVGRSPALPGPAIAAPAHEPAYPGDTLAEACQQRAHEPDARYSCEHDPDDRDDFTRFVVHACVPRLEALGCTLDVIGERPGHQSVDSTHVHSGVSVVVDPGEQRTERFSLGQECTSVCTHALCSAGSRV